MTTPALDQHHRGTRHVLVIGAGGAGLAAALEARQAGAEVTLVDGAEKIGGATVMSGGVVFAAGTDAQAEAGIHDTPDELYAYYMGLAHYRLEPCLIRTLAEKSVEVVKWLQGYGVKFEPQRLYVAGIETQARGHLPTGDTGGLGPAGGAVVTAALLREVELAGVHVSVRTRVMSLERPSNTGCFVARAQNGETFTADAVVLATGGFGGNTEMLARFYPDATKHGDWHWYMGPPCNVGDGITLGLSLGGVVINQNSGLLMSTPNFQRAVDGYLPPWIVLINQDGKRFINEMAPYCVLGHVISAQKGSRCYAVFDSASLAEAKGDPKFTDPYGLGVGLVTNWTTDILEGKIQGGQITQAASLEELGSVLEIPVDNIKHTIELWNGQVSHNKDTIFEKPALNLRTIQQGPFFAVDFRPAIVGITFTGMQIDQEARLLDAAGRPVPGVYAAGELVGGLEDRIYPAGGSSIASALVYGRIAGANAARC